MFGFLKQKIADFGSKLKQTISKEEKKQEETTKEVVEEKKETTKKEQTKHPVPQQHKENIPTHTKKEVKEKEISKQKEEEFKIKEKKELTKSEPISKEKEETKEKIVEEKISKKQIEPTLTTKPQIEQEKEKPKGILGKIFGFGKQKQKEETKKEIKEKIIEQPKIKKEEIKTQKEFPKETPKEIEEVPLEEETPQTKEIEPIKREKVKVARVDEDKRELKATIGVGSGLKGIIFGGIEITSKQIEDLLFELELSLIEGDVDADAAQEIVNQIKQRLVGKKVSAKNIDEYLNKEIKEIITEMMKTETINVLENAKEAKKKGEVYKILLLGPNGAGKTTAIAKLANYFKKNGLSCILAAGDTFRAGAIDQIEVHAQKLGVRLIKHQYGADPAAIAFDAISAAKAGKIDVVLIDSAGRQETNKNLMEELKKLQRVAQPNLKIFVGESYAGQGLLDQVEEFNNIIELDGYILTKIDTDAKGGSAISLTYKTKKPIIFIGTGQEYDDFEEFSSDYIINRII
ncbi:MAG: signal recognition particle-docking protein FtsY [Candidatus Iainarchaeum sp.]|jgi:fused signal recognition particle receptor|nr:MAG: Signal recognition particle 54 kDa protein [archaeon ADurb.Bin336]